MIDGYLDKIDDYLVQGWCFDNDSPDKIVEVSLYIDGKLISKQNADLLRTDLLKSKHPTGYCGFKMKIPCEIDYNGQKIVVFSQGVRLKSQYNILIKSEKNQLINKIQIYGERASGTNFLKHLLINNLPQIIHTNEFGWKHFFPPPEFPDSDKCLFLVIYRDPFDWIRSLYSQPNHAHSSLRKISFSEFIRKEWHCIYDELAGVNQDDERYGQEMMFERNPINGKRFKNALKLRSAKIEAFERLKEKVKHVKYIRYEVLKVHPENFLKQLSSQFRLELRYEFQAIKKYKGVSKKNFIPKNYFQISKEDLIFIKRNLNIPLEKQIGYSFFIRLSELSQPQKKSLIRGWLFEKIKIFFNS